MLMNLAALEKKCQDLGLDYQPTDGKKLGKAHCVAALRAHFLPPEGLPYEEIAPQLAFPEWNLKALEIRNVQEGPDWGAQCKFNGYRLIIYFIKGVGVFATTRTVSVKTFRLEEMSSKLLFGDHVPDFTATVDCEGIIEKPVDTGPYTMGGKGVVTKSSLHSAVAVAHLNAEGCLRLQREQNAPFVFKVFDVLNLDGESLMGLLLREREKIRMSSDFQKRFSLEPLLNQFEFPELVQVDRLAYRDKIIKAGGEGVIWKNLNATYTEDGRQRNVWVKHKKRIEFDAFVSGFKPGESGKGFEHLVAALEFSVNLKEGGTHVLGWASNLTRDHMNKMTVTVDGKPTLHPSMLNRVAEISGQDVSAREFRLSHCTLDRWRYQPGPDFKSADQCVVSMQDLKEAAEWVG